MPGAKEPAIKVFFFFKRKEGTGLEAFRDHYENHHSKLGVEAGGKDVLRYVRNYWPDGNQYRELAGHMSVNAAFDYDVLTELWFSEEEDLHSFLRESQKTSKILEDDKSFLSWEQRMCFIARQGRVDPCFDSTI